MNDAKKAALKGKYTIHTCTHDMPFILILNLTFQRMHQIFQTVMRVAPVKPLPSRRRQTNENTQASVSEHK